MKTITTFVFAAGLALSVLPAGLLESQETTPPHVTVRIGGKRATGKGELQVTAQTAALKTRGSHLLLQSDANQRVEIRGLGPLSAAVRSSHRLRFEQQIEEDGRRVFVALLPPSGVGPATLVHLDWGDRRPVRKEILPGLFLSQRDEPGARPDVVGGSARRTWLRVEVQGLESSVTLEGGETRTIIHGGVTYRLHVYRSLRRDPGTNPRLPFEGERYLLSATLTPM